MKQLRRRTRLLELGVLLVWVGLVGKLFDVQIIHGRHWRRKGEALYYKRVDLLGERGKFYDRKGRLLTLNRSCCSVGILPQWVKNRDNLVRLLSELGLGSEEENRDLLKKHRKFFWFRRCIDHRLGDSLRRALIKCQLSNAVLIYDDYKRLYPYGGVADVVGFVGAERGLAGLEWELDAVLRGEPGWLLLQRDAKGYASPYPSHPMKRPIPGADVYLTIDIDIQKFCYEILAEGVNRTGAKRGAVVVLDARTGAILAMVDYPSYDPNRFADYPQGNYKADAVSDQFEPGSSFKLVTCAAALEDPVPERFTNRVYDVSSGFIQLGNKKIKDVHPNGVLSFDSVFINSSNSACVMMSFDLNPELYYQVVRRLGFGEPVGIGLPNEGAGRIDAPPQLRNRLRFATISFGQGVTVTLLQLAAAYLTVANNGVYLKPFLIEKIQQGGRKLVQYTPVPVRQALKVTTAQRIKDILSRVVKNGTGKLAAIEGTEVCGKTGTAQKVEPRGGYSSTRSLMTFVGFFPREQPRYVIGVMIDEPTTVRFAGSAACPVFKKIGEKLLHLEKYEERLEVGWRR